MTQQAFDFDHIAEYITEQDRASVYYRQSELTSRQWRLYDHLKQNTAEKRSQTYKQILESLDELYGYTLERESKPKTEFNNLQCKRKLATDIEAISKCTTIQMVYVRGKGRFAITIAEKDAEILRRKIAALEEWKAYHVQKMKAALDGQQRLVFKNEKYHWDSILREDDENIANARRAYTESIEKE